MNFHQEKCAEKKLAERRACSQQKTKTFNPTSIIDDIFDWSLKLKRLIVKEENWMRINKLHESALIDWNNIILNKVDSPDWWWMKNY